jgi:polysaccharide export outer membrane protein
LRRLELRSKQLLEDYFKKRQIFCDCKLAGFKYTINGEIGGTGTRVLFQEHVTILEAIANSGDMPLLEIEKQLLLFEKQGTETRY